MKISAPFLTPSANLSRHYLPFPSMVFPIQLWYTSSKFHYKLYEKCKMQTLSFDILILHFSKTHLWKEVIF